jgi:hypothetical protein
MDIDSMIAVLEAAKRGEKIEHLPKGYPNTVWQPKDHEGINTFMYDYRVAPKPKMTLVARLRMAERLTPNGLHGAAADRIEELEGFGVKRVDAFTTDELLDELKRRMLDRTVKEME